MGIVLLRIIFTLGLCGALLNGQQAAELAMAGDKALASGRYAEAAAAYEKLRQLDPAIAEVHAKLGLIYFQQGRFAQAVPVLRQALKLKPALPNADILLAMSLSETGRHEEALPGLEKGFRRVAADPVLKRMCGLELQRAYTGLRRDAKATEVALELTRLYPDDPEVLYHASRLFSNYAYLAMRRLSEKAPDSVWRLLAAGETHESEGKSDLAIAKYREILAIDPERPGIYYRIGRAMVSDPGRAIEARKAFERELRIDPTNANSAYEIGEMHRKAVEPDQARKMFEAALEHDQNFEEALIGLGKVLLVQRKPELAVPHLRKAVEVNKDNEVAHYQLAQAYRILGNTVQREKALAEFRRLRQRADERVAVLLRNVTRQEIDPDGK